MTNPIGRNITLRNWEEENFDNERVLNFLRKQQMGEWTDFCIYGSILACLSGGIGAAFFGAKAFIPSLAAGSIISQKVGERTTTGAKLEYWTQKIAEREIRQRLLPPTTQDGITR